MLQAERNDAFLDLLFEFGLGQDANGRWRRLLGDQLTSLASALRFLLYFAIEQDRGHSVALLARHGVDLASPFTDLTPSS